MFEIWKGGSFIRIHHIGCMHSDGQREIDPDAEQVMQLDGEYETMEEAEAAAASRVSRWKSA